MKNSIRAIGNSNRRVYSMEDLVSRGASSTGIEGKFYIDGFGKRTFYQDMGGGVYRVSKSIPLSEIRFVDKNGVLYERGQGIIIIKKNSYSLLDKIYSFIKRF